MSHGNGIDGRPGGRFGAATPGMRFERAPIGDLVTMRRPGPSARRRRVITPWRMAALIAAIIVAGGTYALGRYVIAPKPAQEVRLAITTTALSRGEPLTSKDFGVVTVRRSPASSRALTWDAAQSLINHVAIEPIPAGTFLARRLLSQGTGRPDASRALVGLALKPGQMPVGGVAVGQQVDIVLLEIDASKGAQLMPGATIWALLPPDSSGEQVVTVVVSRNQAQKLANYAAHGQVSLIATPPHQG